MKLLFDKRVIFSVLVLSFLLLIISFIKFQKSENEQNQEIPSKISTKKSKIEISQFDLGGNLINKQLLAFGVIDSKTCPTCINEMIEYLVEIEKIDKEFFKANGIKKTFIITADNSKDAERFIRATEIEHEWFFVNYKDSLSELITKWPEANTYSNQWLFINPKNSVIESRIIVGNAHTPIFEKRSLLDKAIFAYSNNN